LRGKRGNSQEERRRGGMKTGRKKEFFCSGIKQKHVQLFLTSKNKKREGNCLEPASGKWKGGRERPFTAAAARYWKKWGP